MAFDETQRGRGVFYSDKNRGADSTIESSYSSNYKSLEELIASSYQDLSEEIEKIKNGESLPIATSEQLGTIKVGSGLQIDDGILNVDITTANFDDGPNGLEATNVAGAIEEIAGKIQDLQESVNTYHATILGVQIDFENNMSERLGKAYDSVTQTAVDFDNFDVYSKRTRCTVADDGTINHFFGETGYTEDGTDGQVMVYQPKFYYKVEPVRMTKQDSGDGYDLDCAKYYISDKKIKGFKIHPAFIDDNGEEVDYYLVAAFDGVLTTKNDNSTVDATAAGYLSSFAAANTGTDGNPVYSNTAYASTNLTRSDFEKTAQNRGINWHICTYKIQAAEQLLMMIEFGTMNLQGIENEDDETVSKAIGGGLLAAGTTGVDFKNNTFNGTGTGYRIGLGGSTIETVKGAYNDYISPIVYRGLENPWGNVTKWIDGINYNGTERIAYIANTNSFTENTDTGYTSCGFLLAGSNGFISAMGYNENMDWVLLPSKVEGQNIGIVGDYYYQNAGWRVAMLHGNWYYDSSTAPRSGAFYWYLYYGSSSRDWYIGARAAYCPQKSENSYSINLNKIKSLS